jgi:hypothetical protein
MARARRRVDTGVGVWPSIRKSGWNAVKCTGASGPNSVAIHSVRASSSPSESFSPGIRSVVISSQTFVS